MRSVPQCAAVCRSVPHCAAVCRSVPQCAAVCRSVVYCTAVCYSVLERATLAQSSRDTEYNNSYTPRLIKVLRHLGGAPPSWRLPPAANPRGGGNTLHVLISSTHVCCKFVRSSRIRIQRGLLEFHSTLHFEHVCCRCCVCARAPQRTGREWWE